MKLDVTILQMGPFYQGYEANLEKGVALLDLAVAEKKPDVLLYSEMMTAPYFGGVRDRRYFSFAESRDGRFATVMAEKAKEHGVYIIGTWFEKEENGSASPYYYNSAGVFCPEKGLIGVYRKTHLPKVESADLITDEKFYFKEGSELPIFRIKGIEIGILICYDRSFPEAWRTLWLQGAKVVFVPVATYGFRKEIFSKELQIRAAENHLYVVAANKAGEEQVEGEKVRRNHFGHSCVIDPSGKITSQLGDKPFAVLHETLDLNKIRQADDLLDWRRDRRPDLYGKITE